MVEPILRIQNLNVHGGERLLIDNVNLDIARGEVLGLIGPSGAGKSTLLRCLNRMTDLTPGLRVTGQILFHNDSIRSSGVDADRLRERIGMMFQQPVVFPQSIYENVIFGLKHLGRFSRAELPAAAEGALREAALWDEVKDRLKESALKLSVGQQQRLCLARTLAIRPEVILMDEPTSALDPHSTQAIEELIGRLKSAHTIVLVTHDHGQAERVCDRVQSLAQFSSGASVGIGQPT